GIKDVRKDRTPYGMSKDEADYLNKWLGSNGHARRDQSVLCTANKQHVELFGNGYMIFPLDTIKKYTWFEGSDINIEQDRTGWEQMTVPAWMSVSGGDSYVGGELADQVMSKLTKPFDKFFHTNKGFDTAHKKGYEMWIDCKQYIFVDADWHDWDKTKQVLV
ncbi:MAG: hypothetical protein KAS32_00825, partial [Candidatus Peribacteraceae bacterium]|nr:hypothetical protein [Candidatus Peribacteraceae bacterium]